MREEENDKKKGCAHLDRGVSPSARLGWVTKTARRRSEERIRAWKDVDARLGLLRLDVRARVGRSGVNPGARIASGFDTDHVRKSWALINHK